MWLDLGDFEKPNIEEVLGLYVLEKKKMNDGEGSKVLRCRTEGGCGPVLQ